MLVNNGRYIGPGHMDPFESTPIELIEQMLLCNVIAPLHLIKLCLAHRAGACRRRRADRTHGAKTLAPALCEWRAELAAVLGDEATRVERLRESHQLYEQIGAPLQAARIGQLLSESTS